MRLSPLTRYLGKPLDPDTASRLSLLLPVGLVALGVTIALIRWFRMRRKPPQEWAWNAVKAGGYVPSIVPEAI